MVLYENLMAPVLGTSKTSEPFKSEQHNDDDDMDIKESANIHLALNTLLERHSIYQFPGDNQELRTLFVEAYRRLRIPPTNDHQQQQQQQQQQQLQLQQLQLEAAAADCTTDVYLMQIMHQMFDQHPDWLDRRNNNQPPAISPTVAATAVISAAAVDDETSSIASSSTSSSNPPSVTASSSSSRQRQSRPFKCTVCGKEFGYKHVLQNHERTHTGEKPFVCSVCKKCFTRDHHLKTHVRLHTGEKPFWCPHCNRFFVQVANLRRHLKTHTGESSHPCEYCVAYFQTAAELKDHKRQHKENNKPRGGDTGVKPPQKRRRGNNNNNNNYNNNNNNNNNKDATLVAVTAEPSTSGPWSPAAHGSPPPSPLPSVPSSYWSSPPPQPQMTYIKQQKQLQLQTPVVSSSPAPTVPSTIEPYHHYLQFIARFQSPERNEPTYAGTGGAKFQSPEQTEPEDLSVKSKSNPDAMIIDISRAEQSPVDLAMDLTCK